jgi:hypothetical protein
LEGFHDGHFMHIEAALQLGFKVGQLLRQRAGVGERAAHLHRRAPHEHAHPHRRRACSLSRFVGTP